jgi:hypothetical protein
MAINIQIGSSAEEPEEQLPNKPEQELPPSDLKMKLLIRRSLDGDIIISDHPDVDIVVQPNKMKIVAFPKTIMNDEVYATQNRLFDFLQKGGIITRDSVRGGNVYGALEGTIGTPTKKISIDEIGVFSVGKFIEEERPSYIYEKALEEKEEDRLTEPEVEDSTELGEIPHEEEKGSIIPGQVRRYLGSF